MEIVPIVYLIVNKDSGKVYIGKTGLKLGNRWSGHLSAAKYGTGYYLHDAINRHGRDRFDICTIDSAETERDCYELEKFYIAQYNSTDPSAGYNLGAGGEGVDFTPEVRKKLSDSVKRKVASGESTFGAPGVKLDPDMVERRSAVSRGRPLTEAHKFALRVPKSRPSVVKGTVHRVDVPNQKIAELYQQGFSCGKIAKLYNTTRSTISWRLRNLGVEMRPSYRSNEVLDCQTGV